MMKGHLTYFGGGNRAKLFTVKGLLTDTERDSVKKGQECSRQREQMNKSL